MKPENKSCHYGVENNYENTHLKARTTCVCWYQKGNPFQILMKIEMMEWHWHQWDHMQIICTSLQRDNHASIQSLTFLQARCSL